MRWLLVSDSRCCCFGKKSCSFGRLVSYSSAEVSWHKFWHPQWTLPTLSFVFVFELSSGRSTWLREPPTRAENVMQINVYCNHIYQSLSYRANPSTTNGHLQGCSDSKYVLMFWAVVVNSPMLVASVLAVPLARIFIMVKMKSAVKVNISEQGKAGNAEVFQRWTWKAALHFMQSFYLKDLMCLPNVVLWRTCLLVS